MIGYSEGHPPPGMSGTGPWTGPPELKRLLPCEVAAGLAELGAGEAEEAEEVAVVVGAAVAVVGAVVGAGEVAVVVGARDLLVVGAGGDEEGVVRPAGVVVC